MSDTESDKPPGEENEHGEEGEQVPEDTSEETGAIPSEGAIERRTSAVMNIDPDYHFLGKSFIQQRSDCTKALEEILKGEGGVGSGDFEVRLDDKLGKGGMGQVYLGRVGQETRIAVKVLDATTHQDLVDRFNREKGLLGVIASDGHPNIVQIYGSGETVLKTCDNLDKRVMFILMECVKHEDMNEMINRIPSEQLPSVPQMFSIMKQMADAIKKVHAPQKDSDGRLHRIIHRDVKPENIFLNDEGVAKLADVGVGKDLEGQGSAAETAAGFLVGTPAYMSPEQARGDSIDQKTDIYSWGSTSYFLLTKTVPYPGAKTADIIPKIQNANTPLDVRNINKDVPVKLAQIIEVCTAPDRNDRFDANELVHTLALYDKVSSYAHTNREEVIKDTKKGWGSPGKDKLESLVKAHEQAFWFTGGKERVGHQKKIEEYFEDLNLLGEGISEEVRLALQTTRKLKQINGEVKEEEKTRRIEGWGILGKKAAQDVMDNITNAEELWEKGDYHLALPIVVKARKDYRELRKGWKPQVKEELDKFHALLDGSMLAAQAQECFRQCRDRASERKVEEAKTAFRQGEERLAEIPEAIQKYGFRELKNKQVAHVIEVIKPEAERILQVETNMYNIDTFLEQMNDYIKRESFSSADSLHMQIQQILPLIPVSERARRLRRKSLEMKDALEKAKHFTEAKRYHQEAVENLQERTLKSCDLAARRLSEARAITSKHLQGDDPEYVSFKEQLEAATTSQIRLQEDLRLFGAVQGKVVGTEGREGLYQEFLKDIIPEFEPGNAPNLEKLVAFRSQVMSQIGDLARVDQESVGADYNNIKSRLEGLKEEVERKEKDYIDERFDAAEVCIQGIKGEASEKEYSAQKSAAEKELMEARRVMSALSPEALTEKEDEEELSVQEKYDKLDRGIRDAYNTAEFVVQGRKAIKAELFEQARSILGMVPESKQAEVEKYIDVITLEVEYRADEKNYFWAVPNIGLNDKVVEGYRSGARTFRDSDGEDPFPLVGILSDIERKNIKFEGAPVDEIKELLDQLGRKRIGKEEAKVEICDKVDALIEGIDAYLHTSGVGEKKLKREFAVKLGQAYVAAGFEELGNKYLQG